MLSLIHVLVKKVGLDSFYLLNIGRDGMQNRKSFSPLNLSYFQLNVLRQNKAYNESTYNLP